MSTTPFWGPDFAALQAEDPEIADVVLGELDRLRGGLQLIASENFTSPAVLAALGSTLSNKYAEGYPGRRYYGGCQQVDIAEEIGIARAKELFGAEHANLQPHSGASANLAAYAAICQPGDTVLAMSLPHGGHLTHGSKVSFSGKWFNTVVVRRARGHRADRLRPGPRPGPRAPAEDDHRRRDRVPAADRLRRVPADRRRGRRVADGGRGALHRAGRRQGDPVPGAVRRRRLLHHAQGAARPARRHDRVPRGAWRKAIDKAVFPFTQGGPLMHSVAAKAVALKEAAQPEYQAYARQVIANAQALAEGLAAEGMRPVSGGTDTHLALIDLREVGVTGKDAEARCDAARITLNKNAIPYDPQPPMMASGIRVGTPAVTTQGMTETDIKEVAGADRPRGPRPAARPTRSAAGVRTLVEAHPAYPAPGS